MRELLRHVPRHVRARRPRHREARRRGRRDARRRGLRRASTELCWQCKLCYIKCPYTPDEGHAWLVDVPRLLTREKAQRARRNGVRCRTGCSASRSSSAQLTRGADGADRELREREPPRAQGAARRSPASRAEFPLPPFATHDASRDGSTQHEPLARRGRRAAPSRSSRRATATTTSRASPRTRCACSRRTAVRVVRPDADVLRHAEPRRRRHRRRAREGAAQRRARSSREVDAGRNIVVAAADVRVHDPQGVARARSARRGARRSPRHTFDVMEFLEQLRSDKTLARDFEKGARQGRLPRAVPPPRAEDRLPRRRACSASLPDTEVEIVEQCSAVDGTWGMKAQHYEMGRSYAQKLVARHRRQPTPKLVVTDCPLVGAAHREGERRAPLHPVEALAEAYGIASDVGRMEVDMKPIERGEILGLADYEAIRERFRARVIEEKKRRRVALGPNATRALREPRHRAPPDPGDAAHRAHHARGGHPARDRHVQRARPGDGRALVHRDDRDPRQGRARRVPRRGAGLRAARLRSSSTASASPRRGTRRAGSPDRTSAVHYLKFPLDADAAAHLRARSADATVALAVDHPAYAASVRARARQAVASLAEDLVPLDVDVFVYERPCASRRSTRRTSSFFARFSHYCHEAMEALFGGARRRLRRARRRAAHRAPAVHVEVDFRRRSATATSRASRAPGRANRPQLVHVPLQRSRRVRDGAAVAHMSRSAWRRDLVHAARDPLPGRRPRRARGARSRRVLSPRRPWRSSLGRRVADTRPLGSTPRARSRPHVERPSRRRRRRARRTPTAPA